MKRQHTEWEKIFANHISNKQLISKIYKEFIQFNSKEINNPINKWAKDLNRHFSQEDIQVAKKYMKRCWATLITREMQIKTTMKSPHTCQDYIIKKTRDIKCWWEYGEKGKLAHFRWECKLVQSLWKTVWKFSEKLKLGLLCDPAIPLLGIHPKETKSLSWRDIYILTFIATLFTIVKVWKQSKCWSTVERVKKMWDIYTSYIIYIMEYYSSLQKKEILLFAIWVKLEGIMLSEISQTERDKYCIISLIFGIWKTELIKSESSLVVARGWG